MPVNINKTTKLSVLRRSGSLLDRFKDAISLLPAYETIAKPALRVFGVWIADTKRKVVSALAVFDEYIEVPLWSRSVALMLLVRDGIETQPNSISPEQFLI
jgi:hypothetical protein